MLNILREPDKKFILRNCLLLSTVCAGLLFSGNARAEIPVYYNGAKHTFGIDSSDEIKLGINHTGENQFYKFTMPESDKENIFTAKQTFNSVTFSSTGSATVNTIATSVSSSSTNKQLVTAKGVYDALKNAGVTDMSIYAKTDDVYGKSEVYTKDEADGKFLTSHQDISGKANVGDSYTKAESDGKYATKSALNEYIKSSEIYDYIDYVAPKAITPTRDAMIAYQNDANHGKYVTTSAPTGADKEQLILLSSSRFYFVPNEVSHDMEKTLNQLLTSTDKKFSYSGDYVFTRPNMSGSWTFDTSALSASNIITTEATLDDYTYTKADENGFLTAYKVSGLRNTDERNTNLTTNIIGGYYEGQKSTKEKEGGALTITNNTINKIEADFVGNQHTNGQSGGAIYNGEGGIVKMLIGDFAGNSARYGGAITNANTITTILGDFNGNTASGSGGAISNSGTITTLIGDYNGNTATVMGGAVFNGSGSTITTLSGNFNNNTATNSFGGAILNGGVISSIIGDFNYNKSGNYGGAIYNTSANSEIGTITGNFNNNKTVKFGGAIYNEQGTIHKLIGNFNSNKSEWDGGAIYNASNGTIETIIGNFEGNESSDGAGIYNAGIIENYTGDFKNNKATTSGGAISNSGTIGLLAKNQDITFYNNIDSTGYNDLSGGTYNLNAQSGYKINFGGSIRNAQLNINNDTSEENSGGEYIFNNKITSSMKLYNGANVKLGSIKQEDGTTTYGYITPYASISLQVNGDGNNIDMRNDHIDTNTVSNLSLGGNLGLSIDTSLRRYSDSASDTLVSKATATGDGKMIINAINLTNSTYGEGDSIKISIADDKTKGKIAIADDILDNITGATNYYTKVEYDEDTGDLVFTDKLVNKSTLDQALQDAGIGDMSIYAKTADVYDNVYTKSQTDDKFATKESLGSYVTSESLGTTLGGYVTTDGLNTALTPYAKSSDVAETYATKDSITDMLTKTEAGSTYATKTSVYTKDEANETFAVKGSSYTKSEIDETLSGYVTTGGLNTALTPYAKSSDVADTYATKEALTTGLGNKVDTSAFNEYKTEVNNTYAKSGDVYSKNDIDTKFGGYVKSDDLSTTLSDYAKSTDLNDYAKSSDLGAYAKTSDIAETYATKHELGNYVTSNSLDNKLGDYAKTSDLSDYAKTSDLGSYVKSSDLNSTLSGYAKTSDISDMLTKTEAGNTYATKASLNDYATKTSLNDYVKSDTLDSTLSGYAKSSDLDAYAKTSDISDMLTKTEAGNTYATKASLNDYATKTSLNDYVKSDTLDSTLSGYAKSSDLDAYAKTSDISDMLTKTEAGNTYATKDSLNGYAKSDDVYSKNDMDTKLSGYVTSDNLDAKLGSYVKSDDLTTTLGSYAKTEDIANTYATKDELDGKVDTSAFNTYKTEVGNTYATKDELGNKADVSTVTALQTTVSDLSDTVAGKANQSDLETLQTTVAGKANAADVYTKDEADNKYATQNAISDMLTKTEAGNTYATQSALNDYKTSNDNAVSALTGKMTQVETDISGIKGSAVMSSGITAEKVAAYEGYAALIDAKQDALSTEQMAVLNSGITAADIATVQTANARLDAMDTTVADLSADFGDVSDFTNSKTGNLKNDVPSSSKPNATTVTKAIANMDATIGQIHGLAAKVGVENGGANLGQNTTVEEHLTSLAGSIGNRTHYTQQNYIKNNQTVAQSLDNLDVAVGSIRRDFNSAQIANEARFNDIEHNISHLENKMEKGLAANNALAGLKPLSSTSRTQLSAAMGGYENNQAFAIGGFHYVTDKVLLNTGVAYGGNNSMSYNVGVTFGF